MIDKIKSCMDKITALLELNGDVWMSLFTGFILLRIIMVLKGQHPLTASEASVYGTAVSAFAFSNTRGPKS